jgi:enoyl-CoA hydratase/carnithine racemase
MLQKPALEMLLTGDIIDAPTAHERVLVNRVVPPGSLDAAVENRYRTLNSCVSAGSGDFSQQLPRQ